MTEQRPQPGDRVRVTYEATVDEVGPGGMRVVLPGALYFCQVPPGATVEVLRPPTLAERMAALADELERSDELLLAAAARRLREELDAHGADLLAPLRQRLAEERPAGERQLCGSRYSHGPRHPVVACTRLAGHEGPHNWADVLAVDL